MTGSERNWRRCGQAAMLVALALFTASCSDDAAVRSGSPSASTSTVSATAMTAMTAMTAETAPSLAATTEVAPSIAPITTAPTTTTPATVRPPTVPPVPHPAGVVGTIPVDGVAEPRVEGTDLVDRRGVAGAILAANIRSTQGRPTTAAIWSTEDGRTWTQGGGDQLATGDSSWVNDLQWSGDTLVMGGWTSDAGGRHAAVWLAADGQTFAPPEVPFGPIGIAEAVSAGPDGVIAAGFLRPDGALPQPVVARRATDGTWMVAPLATEGVVDLSGVATIGDTVVLAGTRQDGRGQHATAWVSTDRGATFVPADTTAIDDQTDTALGELTTWDTGFVVAACLSDGDQPTGGILTSADGLTWTRLTINATDSHATPIGSLGAECSSLFSTGDHVLLGELDLVPTIVEVDVRGTGHVIEAARTPEHHSDDSPFAVPGSGGLIVVSRESGGFAAGISRRGATAPTASGLPIGGPRPWGVHAQPVAGGVAFSVVVAPVVEELGKGNHSWASRQTWLQSPDLVTWSPPPGFDQAKFNEVSTSGVVDIGFSTADDRLDDGGGGPRSGTAVWSRTAGQPWAYHGLVLSGPGGDYVEDSRWIGDRFLAVGGRTIRDPQTGLYTSTPVAISSVDGEIWQAEALPPIGDDASLDTLCPLPGGRVMALGGSDAGNTTVALARDQAGTWQTIDASTVGSRRRVTGCAANGAAVVVSTSSNGLHPTLLTTTDGATLRVVELGDPSLAGARFEGVVAVGQVFVAGGVTPAGGADRPQLWTSSDGTTWAPLVVDGWDGIADVDVTELQVVGDRVVLTGLRNLVPTVWSVATAGVPGG